MALRGTSIITNPPRKASKARLVTQMGAVWRLAPDKYARLVMLVKSNQEYDLNKLGTYLGDTVAASDVGWDE